MHLQNWESIESTKTLIDITHFQFIDDWLCFSLGGYIFYVHVKEVEWDAVRF